MIKSQIVTHLTRRTHSYYNLLHPTLLLRIYHGGKILLFDTGSSFLLKIHIIFYWQYAKFRNAAYEKIYVDLLQSFLKFRLKAHSQLSKKIQDKFCSPSFRVFNHLTILSSRKNVSSMLCLILKILTEKNTLISLTSFFTSSAILSGLLLKTS